VRCAREHNSLSLDVVVGLLQFDDVCCVDEHVHEAGMVLPLHLERLHVEHFDYVVGVGLLKQVGRLWVLGSLDSDSHLFEHSVFAVLEQLLAVGQVLL